MFNVKTIKVESGRQDYYNNLLDKYDGPEALGYKLDTKEKEDKFLEEIVTIINEDMEFSGKLRILSFLVYQVQIVD